MTDEAMVRKIKVVSIGVPGRPFCDDGEKPPVKDGQVWILWVCIALWVVFVIVLDALA